MIDAITSFIGRKPRAKTKRPEASTQVETRPHPEPEKRGRKFGFTKMFRWPVPAEQTPQPTSVEVVGSFSEWRRLPLSYDRPTRSWNLILQDIIGNRTHRYVMLVDGNPTYDKTCDGLVTPQDPQEERWQIATPKGPRVMLLFSQTK
jgi:hypothetical protein